MINNTTQYMKVLLLLIFSISAPDAFASSSMRFVPSIDVSDAGAVKSFLQTHVKERYNFVGLASYYHQVNFYTVDKNGIQKNTNGQIQLNDGQWLVAVGRLDALAIYSPGTKVMFLEDSFELDTTNLDSEPEIILVKKNKLKELAPELDIIRYTHLWKPLAALSRAMEWSFVKIQTSLTDSWGLTIILFAIFLKLALIPLSLLVNKFQRQVSQHQAVLAPKIAEVKAKYKGEQAHNKILALHEDEGVSTFYTLKPMVGALIQVPILVAVFNALGEMPQFSGQQFFWINDLSYPDTVFSTPYTIYLFGSEISLLPILMTLSTVFSTFIFRNKLALPSELKKQKTNLYIMAFAFFVLFYPFPASMVLFWLVANLLQLVQQQLLRL